MSEGFPDTGGSEERSDCAPKLTRDEAWALVVEATPALRGALRPLLQGGAAAPEEQVEGWISSAGVVFAQLASGGSLNVPAEAKERRRWAYSFIYRVASRSVMQSTKRARTEQRVLRKAADKAVADAEQAADPGEATRLAASALLESIERPDARAYLTLLALGCSRHEARDCLRMSDNQIKAIEKWIVRKRPEFMRIVERKGLTNGGHQA